MSKKIDIDAEMISNRNSNENVSNPKNKIWKKGLLVFLLTLIIIAFASFYISAYFYNLRFSKDNSSVNNDKIMTFYDMPQSLTNQYSDFFVSEQKICVHSDVNVYKVKVWDYIDEDIIEAIVPYSAEIVWDDSWMSDRSIILTIIINENMPLEETIMLHSSKSQNYLTITIY